jgi:hypothetical protein
MVGRRGHVAVTVATGNIGCPEEWPTFELAESVALGSGNDWALPRNIIRCLGKAKTRSTLSNNIPIMDLRQCLERLVASNGSAPSAGKVADELF